MPRPRKLTKAKVEQVLASLRAGADMRMAARAIGVRRQVIYHRMEADPAFKEEITEARNFADERVVESLYKQAISGNTTAMIFWLKNRKRHEWRDKYDHEVVESQNQPAQVDIFLSDGETAFPPTTVTTVPGPSTRQ